MRFFPVFFLAGVTFMHAHFFWTLQRIFPRGPWEKYVLAFFAASFVLLLLGRRLRGLPIGEIVSVLFYAWLGFLIVVTLFNMARDAVELSALLIDRLAGVNWRPFVSGSRSVAIGMAVGVAGYLWSLHEARDIRVRPLAIETDLLPEGRDRLRVAVLTDIHVTAFTAPADLERMIRLSNAQKPDIVVAVGDTVDGNLEARGSLADALRRLDGPLGKYAVLGNHERHFGIEQSIAFLEGAGFAVLRGEAAEAGGIRVVGIDDPSVPGRTPLGDALDKAAPDRFILVLSHRHDVPPEALGRFDVLFAGHTHGGQIWPGKIIVEFLGNIKQGLNTFKAPAGRPRAQSLVYVSNGTRYWGPAARLLAPPEITVVDIVRAPAGGSEKREGDKG